MRLLRHSALLLFCLLLAACGGPSYKTRVYDTPATQGQPPHQKPYSVNGTRYEPIQDSSGFTEEGLASWYGKDFHGKKTSNGEIYDMYAMTAAHKTLPLGVSVRVQNKSNGRSTVVRVNDRGPFVKGRIIDLSYTAANELGVVGPGTAPVRIEALGFEKKDGSGDVRYEVPPSYQLSSYSVQVGAFTVEDNAKRLAAKLRSSHGFSSVQEGWVAGKRYFRVRAGSYKTIESAEEARGRFEASGYSSSFVVGME